MNNQDESSILDWKANLLEIAQSLVAAIAILGLAYIWLVLV